MSNAIEVLLEVIVVLVLVWAVVQIVRSFTR